MLVCSAWCCGTTATLLPYSFSVCEQAEKLDVLDHAFNVTSMSVSIHCNCKHRILPVQWKSNKFSKRPLDENAKLPIFLGFATK